MSNPNDMYIFGLPAESELIGQAMLEAKNKSASESTPEFDADTFFPFWKPSGPKSGAVKMGDKTGVVKPKVDFNPAETRIDKIWEDFLSDKKARDKKNAKPVTEVDAFGSVVLDTFAKQPKPAELVGSIKALKRIATKSIDGAAHVSTENLGIATVIEKSKAAKPNKDKLVGIVSPKAEMGKQRIPDLLKGGKPSVVDATGSTTTVVNDYKTKLKPTANNVEVKSSAAKPGKGDHTGIVKPQASMGHQSIPDILGKLGKPKVDDVSGSTTTYKSYDSTIKATPNNVEVKSNAAKPGKGDHTGIVTPKAAMGKQRMPSK